MLDLKAIHKAQREAAAKFKRASMKIAQLGLPEDVVANIDAELDKAMTASLQDLSLENLSKLQEAGTKKEKAEGEEGTAKGKGKGKKAEAPKV